jgi:hypothetical protein
MTGSSVVVKSRMELQGDQQAVCTWPCITFHLSWFHCGEDQSN